MTYVISSPTKTEVMLPLIVLAISKSTTGSAVTLSEVALLLVLLVSFSLEVTVTLFEIVPFPITLTTKTNSLDSPLAKSPTVQTLPS